MGTGGLQARGGAHEVARGRRLRDNSLLTLPSWTQLADHCRPTFTYWMRTEVHVYSLAVAASVMISFFPFLIVIVSLCRYVLKWRAAAGAIYAALDDYFPGDMGEFIVHNLSVTVADRGALQLISLLLLLFTANGIFTPLEVALNRVWRVAENRTYWRNQAVSIGLIFSCGTLALISTIFTGMNPRFFRSLFGQTGQFVELAGIALFRITAVPLSILMLLLVYWRLPNRRIGVHQVVPVAVVVGLALEAMKYINLLSWPLWRDRLRGEYGPFVYSVSIILWSFLGAMVLLAGAEWAARREAWAGVPGRGRDAGCPTPPAQTRAGATNAHGSYLECLAANRSLGQGCRISTGGSKTPRRS